MLTYADSLGLALRTLASGGLGALSGDLMIRMLTYAHVCSRMQLASGGLGALSGDLIEQLLGLVPAAMRCTYETAPVVRLYTLEVLTYADVC